MNSGANGMTWRISGRTIVAWAYSFLPSLCCLNQTVWALQRIAAEVLRAINRQQVLLRQKLKLTQNSAVRESLQYIRVHVAQGPVRMAVDQITQLAVAGNLAQPKYGREVVRLHRLLKASLELQQRGILEVEHGEDPQITVAKRVTHLRLLSGIGDAIDVLCDASQQSGELQLRRPPICSCPSHA